MLKQCAEIWDETRMRKPLVHCITNYVTINDVANIILASGASPAMVEHASEAGDFARLSQAVYLNLGTLTNEQESAMLAAAREAAGCGVPLVVDPVACGVIPCKVQLLQKLGLAGKITCIKGNSAEIKHLAGIEARARGVDSLDSGEGLTEAARALARQETTVVAATGEIDVVADPGRTARVSNGSDLFGHITGAGCMVGGVIAACIGACPSDPWLATITGLCAFNIAGERAARAAGDNPGSFHHLLFDHLYHLRGDDLVRDGKVDW